MANLNKFTCSTAQYNLLSSLHILRTTNPFPLGWSGALFSEISFLYILPVADVWCFWWCWETPYVLVKELRNFFIVFICFRLCEGQGCRPTSILKLACESWLFWFIKFFVLLSAMKKGYTARRYGYLLDKITQIDRYLGKTSI